MTDIRDDFEKWYRDSFPKYNLYSKYDQFKEVQATTFQAATLAQQAKIEALEIQVQELREKVAFYDRWLTDGVYHTNKEYEIECSKNRQLFEAYQAATLAQQAKIEALEIQREGWVSVEDRLPDCDEFIGANFRGNAWIAFCWKFKVHNKNGDFYKYTGGETVHKNNLTHWRPLPNPPTEKE